MRVEPVRTGGRVVFQSSTEGEVSPELPVPRAGFEVSGGTAVHLVPDQAAVIPHLDGPSYHGRFDRYAVPTYSGGPPVAGDEECYMIGTGYPVEPGTKVYVGGAILDEALAQSEAPGPAGSVLSLFMGAAVPPGPGTYKYTLFKNGAPTACTFTLTGSNRRGHSKVQVAFADDDFRVVEIDVSANAPRTNHNGTIRFQADP